MNQAWKLTVTARPLADATMRELSTPILAELDDHALIVLVATTSGQHPAATVLLLRHLDWMRRRVVIDGNKLGLSPPDIEDAQQALLYDIVPRAAASFRLTRPESESGQSFESFLRHVLRRRLRNYARQLRRVERHFDRTVDVYSMLELDFSATKQRSRQEWLGDPCRSAELREFFECLHENLQQLRAGERLLWQMTVSRCPVADIARVLKIHYRTAKRWRRRLLTKLRQLVADHLYL